MCISILTNGGLTASGGVGDIAMRTRAVEATLQVGTVLATLERVLALINVCIGSHDHHMTCMETRYCTQTQMLAVHVAHHDMISGQSRAGIHSDTYRSHDLLADRDRNVHS